MNKLAKFGILALLLVALVGNAFAFSGFRNGAAKEAIEADDFTAWKEAMASELTEDRFNKMREKHQQRAEHRAEMEAAMEQGYEAWLEALGDSPRAEYLKEVITENNFDDFVAMHNAKQDGDFETAKQIAEELGLEKPQGRKCLGKGHFKPKMSLE